MGNPVVHFELLSKDPARIGDFYQRLFGWKITARPEFNYSIVEPDAQGDMKGISGGIFKPDQPEPWSTPTTMYVLVDDLAAYGKRVVEAGGKLLMEEQQVPGMGAFTLFADPEGRMMGLWRAAPQQ